MSALLGHSDAWWPNITVSQVSPIQYLLACQKSQRSMPCYMVKTASPGVGFSAVAILGGKWLQLPASDGPPCSCNHVWRGTNPTNLINAHCNMLYFRVHIGSQYWCIYLKSMSIWYPFSYHWNILIGGVKTLIARILTVVIDKFSWIC